MAITLYFFGGLSNTEYVWAFVIAAASGEVIVALGFEAMAPTHVMVGPGDRAHANSPVQDRAWVMTEFSAAGAGKVRVRGEVWNARCLSSGRTALAVGQEVRIAGRDGLTLLIDGGASDA